MTASARRRHVETTPVQELAAATIRFCGDSGDGMQVIGAQLTLTSSRMGNAVSSLPDFPAEIRAPAGTLAGVSGFQVHFSSQTPAVPGDKLQALVAMNPAALCANWKDLESNGILIVNSDAFTPVECAKAGYRGNPLESGELQSFRLLAIPLDGLNRDAVAKLNLTPREADRCRNFFALGMICWLFDRALEPIQKWIESKFAANPAALKGNIRALKAGYQHADAARLLPVRFRVPGAALPEGVYRHLTGTDGLILGLQAASRQSKKPMVIACSPMTPASDLLHAIQLRGQPDVRAIQAENDIAAAGMALGAAFGGAIGVTATNGAGLCQMSEMIGLAAMTELPLVVIDVQRGGPSSGLPTKTEQSDLFQALYGRNGECPLPVLAPASPSECFEIAYEAVRIACRYMTPVLVLTDVFLASSAEPWRLPEVSSLRPVELPDVSENSTFLPYRRDERHARPWAVPGTPGREHRVGGLEKEPETGNVSYDAVHHQAMVNERAEKIAGIVREVPDLQVDGPDSGDLLIIGWGSTLGPISAAVQRLRRTGHSVAHGHLRRLNPLPRNLGLVLRQYRKIIVPELNSGQLRSLLRATYLADVQGINKCEGRPFQVSEIVAAVEKLLTNDPSD